MSYTPEQIRSAARLVPQTTDQGGVIWLSQPHEYLRPWQPWADTESGRSDALVLLGAVMKWYDTATNQQRMLLDDVIDPLSRAMTAGNVESIQAATMAAAVAIGEHLALRESVVRNACNTINW
jgi:hypothetical protein